MLLDAIAEPNCSVIGWPSHLRFIENSKSVHYSTSDYAPKTYITYGFVLAGQTSRHCVQPVINLSLGKLRTCYYPHVPIGKVLIYRLPVFVCLFFVCFFCVFVRLRISQARIKLASSILHVGSGASWAGNLPLWGTLLPHKPKI